MKAIKVIKEYYHILKASAMEFSEDNATKLSASLAYYTVFSIGPLLLVLISVTGLFFEKEKITTQVAHQIETLLGKDGATFVITLIQNMQQQQNSAASFGIIGFVVLIFGASGVFVEIQTSINYIWSIKAKPKKSWLKFLTDRLLSFSLVIGMGFLLIVSLFVNTITDLMTERLQHFLGSENVIMLKVVNMVLLFVVTSFLFGVIYKVLPDATVKWKDALTGACFTGGLFLVGKFLIGYYLGNSKVGTTYGAAASVIILLSWVYYSSIILYFGAEFTKVYSLAKGRGIQPYKTAVYIVKRESTELPNAVVHPEEKKVDEHLHS